MTTNQVRNRTKDVTRRKGWAFLKAGDTVNACVKCMGLKPGEKVERICQIPIVSVVNEPLHSITNYPNDCEREGFPEMTASEFIAMFCKGMGGDAIQRVNRIEFEYLETS